MQNKKMTIVLSIIGVLKSIVVIAQAIFSKILIDKAVNNENLLFTSLIFLVLLLLLTFTYTQKYCVVAAVKLAYVAA